MRLFVKCLIIACLFLITTCTSNAAPLKINGLDFDNSDRIIFINTNKGDEISEVSKGFLSNPDRFYFDITNAELTTPSVTYTLENSVMSEVTISQFTVSPSVVRIVVKYNKNKAKNGFKDFEIEKIGNVFCIKYNNKIVSNSSVVNLYSDNEISISANTRAKVKEKELDQAINAGKMTIAQAFDANANKDVQQNEKKMTSSFYIDKILKTDEGVLIKGVGNLTIKPIFYLIEPNRAIIDIKNANLKQELRNKTYIIGNLTTDVSGGFLASREMLKIAQFEKDTVRLVVQGDNCKNYRLAISPDGQNLYIAKRQDVVNAKLTQYNAVLKGYKAEKDNNTDVLTMNFDSPVSLSVFEENSTMYIDIQNSNDMNQASFAEILNDDYFKDAKLVKIASDKFRVQKPITNDIQPMVKINKTRDEVKIYFNKTTKKQRDEKRNEEIKNALYRNQKRTLMSAYYMVVIDAGHGGEDKGAIRFGTNESDLNLEVARLVEKYLKEKKIHVTMTRNKDVFLELAERVDISNKIGPDAYVSIHHNASLKDEIKGIETHWYREESIPLAQSVHSKLVSNKNLKEWDTLDRGLCKSQFYVINHTEAPAILVEVGFMSNKEELERTKDKKYQEEEAHAIADGIAEYLKSRGKKNGKKKQ